MNQIDKQGWAFPLCSRKAHYFPKDESISLCGKVMFTGGEREDSSHKSPDNCAKCMKLREKRYGGG